MSSEISLETEAGYQDVEQQVLSLDRMQHAPTPHLFPPHCFSWQIGSPTRSIFTTNHCEIRS